MISDRFQEQIGELIRRTSAYLPTDVSNVIELNRALEDKGSKADLALNLVSANIGLARRLSAPICQDTGTINFYIRTPIGFDQLELQEACCDAVALATAKGHLRQNSVDSVTCRNTGNNLGAGSPLFHWHQHHEKALEIRLILKGGGCENMSAQYSLPTMLNDKRIDRNLEGVRACVLDAVWQAQGKGCGPGFLGVCVGGDRASGYDGARNRLPASYFVTIAYMCWAFRRRGVVLDQSGEVIHWLYETPGEFDRPPSGGDVSTTLRIPRLGKPVVQLETPLSTEEVRRLRAGDIVLLSGTIFTGRDAVHQYLHAGGELDTIKGGVIYHCGPVVLKEAGAYRVVAAGPTTSSREEPYQAEVIERFSIKAIIGKGGMGPRTLKACQEHGCVYLHAIGGAAQIYAQCVESVPHVYLEQFGSPEAVWEMKIRDFPAVVTMDSHGRSLHQIVADASKHKLQAVL
jgi:fumarate hydratase class I